MKKNKILAIKPNQRLIGILLGAITLLFVPLVAKLFTNEVKWTLFDFLVAGILLLGTGLTLEFILRKIQSIKYRIVICALLFMMLFLVWAELAVGIFGTPFSGH